MNGVRSHPHAPTHASIYLGMLSVTPAKLCMTSYSHTNTSASVLSYPFATSC